MKDFLFKLAFIALVILAISAIRAYYIERSENKKLSEAYEHSLREGKEQALEPIRTTIDTASNTRAQTYRPIQTVDPSLYVSKDYADTLARALNIAVRQIDRLERYTLTLEDSIVGLKSVDSLGVSWASIKDNVFDIRYNIDSNIFYPRVNLGIDIIGHTEKRHFFARREVVNTVVVNDPRIRINNVRQINRITLPSRFGLDITAGAVLTPQGLTYGVGAGLGYRLIEF